MRKFAILNGARRSAKPCAVLNWDSANDELSIDIEAWANENELPLLLSSFARKGQRHVGDKWARRWVEERIVPSGRQNLGQVLKANNLKFYEPMPLLIAGEGKCSQDDFFIREINETAELGKVTKATKPNVASGSTCTEKTPPEQVGQLIRTARLAAGQSQVELAQKCGIAQSALSNLERGKGNPTLGLLNDVSNALGKSLVVRFE